MDPVLLHERLADLVPAFLFGSDYDGGCAPKSPLEAVLSGVEAHATSGCSRCARALVDARDAVVGVAEAGAARAESATLPPSLRNSVLVDGGAKLAARKGGAAPRLYDPAGEVARRHIGGPGDAERVAEIEALALASPPPDDACTALLAQLQTIVRFPLLFVSVVGGQRAGYRAHRGFDDCAMARNRRRETTFCTHTVSMGEPMIAENPAVEPFFRGSRMVVHDGIRAYLGVPLRTGRGVIVGTVCAMDFVPRTIGPSVVRALELFAEPITAEIERARGGPGFARTAAGAPIHPRGRFAEIVRIANEPKALIVARTDLGGFARIEEPVGGVRDGHGLLVAAPPGQEGRVEARCREVARAASGEALVLRGATVTKYLG
jgi:GAF domain-containing protein